jgi:hypothetical protein
MSAIDIPGPEAEGGAELTKAAILATGLGAADLGAVPTDPAHTQIGAPTTGTHAAGEVFVDSTGTIWSCITAGTPGVWVYAGAGVELAKADLATAFALSSATIADVTGLSVTFTVPSQNFMVDYAWNKLTLSASTAWGYFQVTDSANTELAVGFWGSIGGQSVAPSGLIRADLPTIGTEAYSVTPGTSLTLKVRYQMLLGTATLATDGGTSRPILRVVTC